MSEQSSMHIYLNWTKQRLDEMDAALASLEAKASQQKADVKAKADQLIADLKKRRDEFQAKAKAQAGGPRLLASRKAAAGIAMERFQAQVKPTSRLSANRFEHIKPRSGTWPLPVKAWRGGSRQFPGAAGKMAAESVPTSRRRQQMKAVCGGGRSTHAEIEAGGKRNPGLR